MLENSVKSWFRIPLTEPIETPHRTDWKSGFSQNGVDTPFPRGIRIERVLPRYPLLTGLTAIMKSQAIMFRKGRKRRIRFRRILLKSYLTDPLCFHRHSIFPSIGDCFREYFLTLERLEIITLGRMSGCWTELR